MMEALKGVIKERNAACVSLSCQLCDMFSGLFAWGGPACVGVRLCVSALYVYICGPGKHSGL